MKKYTHILWDWNGTLLDDVAWCIQCENTMLKKRGLPTLDSLEAYHNVFGFPVREYYSRVGYDFDREPYEALAVEYMSLYHGDDGGAGLFPNAGELLATLQKEGFRQVILSASETENLFSQIRICGVAPFFEEILGVSDIYARGKIEIGQAYMERAQPESAVLIGDTTHDKEVADALGADCILVANGHQSKKTLLPCGAAVVDHLAELKNLLLP